MSSKFFPARPRPGRNRDRPQAGHGPGGGDGGGGGQRVSSNGMGRPPSASEDEGLRAAENIRQGLALFRGFGAGQDGSDFRGFTGDEITLTEARALHRRRQIGRESHFLANPEGTPLPAFLRNIPHELPSTVDLKVSDGEVEDFSPAPAAGKTKTLKASTVKKVPAKIEGSRRRVRSLEPPTENTTDNDTTVPRRRGRKSAVTPEPRLSGAERRRSKAAKKAEETPAKKPKLGETDTPAAAATAPRSPKALIRPSKLGEIGGLASPSAPSAVPPPAKPESRLFASSPGDLIIEGKRQWKPSPKVQASQEMKKSISQYANAMAAQSGSSKSSEASSSSDLSSSPSQEKIQRMLASQWDSRLRRVDNKFVKTSRLSEGDGSRPPGAKLQLRESKLELNASLIERLRNPSQQIEFCQAIQQSMQRPDKTPPKLLNGAAINPAGSALVEQQSPTKESFASLSSKDFTVASARTPASSSSNRMPGNIVCGICGALRYYSFILQAKKFGTFSCEPCRKFISKMIKQLKGVPENLQIECVADSGTCVVPPVIRSNCSMKPAKPSGQDSDSSRCQACWLKLCLIGYNLEAELYDALRSHLPQVIRQQLPEADKRGENGALLPHRGQILEFNKQVPLSRPLFEGFGDVATPAAASSTPAPQTKKAAADENKSPVKASTTAASSAPKSNSTVHERLPNGWMKKAVKRLEGEQKGKWDTYLITPDQKMLKSPGDLKLYIAKSGAVVDSNIVNFSLPKKTAKVDKALSQQQKIEAEASAPSSPSKTTPLAVETSPSTPKKISPNSSKLNSPVAREMRKLGFAEDESDSRHITSMELPKNSRRETKVPAKFRDYSPTGRKTKKDLRASDDRDKGEDAMDVDNENDQSSSNSTSKSSSPTPPALPLMKEKPGRGRPSKGPPTTPATIGVGTFSIDKDAVRALPSGSSLSNLKFKKSKRTISCKACENCKKKDCNKCVYCQDRIKNGGKGTLKKVCIERKCLDPQMNGLPAMSTFRTSAQSSEPKRTYIRTATALATKSVPPPSSPTKQHEEGPGEFVEQQVEADDDDVEMELSVPPSESSQPEEDISTTPSPIPPTPPSQSETPRRHSMDQVFVTPAIQLLQQQASNGSGVAKRKLIEKLNENPSTARPNMSFAALIVEALQTFPNREGTLQMIYKQMMDTYPYFRLCDKYQWQNSIRHNLSLQKAFVRSDVKDGKGCYWGLSKSFNPDEFKKKPSKEDVKETKKAARPRKDTQLSIHDGHLALKSNKTTSELSTPPLSPSSPSPLIHHKTIASSRGVPMKSLEHFSDKRQSLEDFLKIGLAEDEAGKIKAALQIDGKHKTNGVSLKPSKKDGNAFEGSMDFWEQYDPEQAVLNGQGVVTTDSMVGVEALCFLCGSSGRDQMIYCKSCCEPFHSYCLQQEELPQTALLESEWTCRRCSLCQVCGDPGRQQDAFRRCALCCLAFHDECLHASQKKDFGSDHPWVCFSCLRCKSCGKSDVAHYLEEEPYCAACCLQKRQGSFCPLCEGCYDDDDYDTRMMECAKCGGWIHAKCEGVDAEKYQILSYLPDTVEYVCKKCHPDGPPDWMNAMNDELKAGQTIILRQLMQSKFGRKFLKATNHTVVRQTKPSSTDDETDSPSSSRSESPTFSLPPSDDASCQPAELKLQRCSVKVVKLKVPKWAEEEALESLRNLPSSQGEDQIETDANCTVLLQDLRYHSFWGPKVSSFFTRLEKKKEAPSSEEEVLDLEAMKLKVEDGHYGSVLAFHLDFKKVCDTVHIQGPLKRRLRSGLEKVYASAMQEVFPWFDVANPKKFFEPLTAQETLCLPPYVDHTYSDFDLKKTTELNSRLHQQPVWKLGGYSPPLLFRDVRLCVLCGKKRDGPLDRHGRLIYFRQNEWVHVNCALWSSEVYEEVDGSLQNVAQAVNRGSKLDCSYCCKRGATIGCCQAGCAKNYHFLCGLTDGASYFDDKTVFCESHSWPYEHKAETKDFSVLRTVHVDLEDSKKRARKIDLRHAKPRLGSLTVHRMGQLHSVASDTHEALVPVGFACTKLFWSHKNPSQLVNYLCQTKLVEPKEPEPTESEEAFHLCIDHSDDEDVVAEAKQKLLTFQRRLRKLEMRRRARKEEILPPNLVGQIWSTLSYSDLHVEDANEITELAENELDAERDSTAVDSQQTYPASEFSTNATEIRPEASNEFTDPSTSSSPSKRLNKAVGNVMATRRTPQKASLEHQHPDHDFDLPDLGVDLLSHVDSDLITTILGDDNFEAELAMSAIDKSSDEAELNSLRRMKSAEMREEVTVMKTWFNQNKLRKFSEVKVQCCLPFETHVFDMDVDYSDLPSFAQGDQFQHHLLQDVEEGEECLYGESNVEQAPGEKMDRSDAVNNDEDILGFVSDNIEKMSHSKEPDLEVVKKILALAGKQIFEMGDEEQTFELENDGSELVLQSEESSCPPTGDTEENVDLLKSFKLQERLPQVDGAEEGDEMEASEKPSEKKPDEGATTDGSSTISQESSSKETNVEGLQPKDMLSEVTTNIEEEKVTNMEVQQSEKTDIANDHRDNKEEALKDDACQLPTANATPSKTSDSVVQHQLKSADGNTIEEMETDKTSTSVDHSKESSSHIEPESDDKISNKVANVAEETSKGEPTKDAVDPTPGSLSNAVIDQSKTVEQPEKTPEGVPSEKNVESEAKPADDGGAAGSEASSPRKDFSIAGLLSPAEAAQALTIIKTEKLSPEKSKKSKKEESDDDDVVILDPPVVTSPKMKSPRSKSRSSASPRRSVPRSPAGSVAASASNPQTAPIFLQQVGSTDQAAAFADSFQNATGRSLQYVASIPQMATTAAVLSPFGQQLQLPPGSNPAAAVLQPFPSTTGFIQAAPLQIAPYIGAIQPQQLGYITPQGFIVNQAPQATPGFLNLAPGAASPVVYGSGASAPVYLSTTPAQGFMSAAVPTAANPFAAGLPTSSFGLTPATTVAMMSQPGNTMTAPSPSGAAAAPPPPPPLSGQSPLGGGSTTPKKVARVQPQPFSGAKPIKPLPSKATSASAGSASASVDPIKALSSMASQPMASHSSQTASATSRLSITHGQGMQAGSSGQQQRDINVTDLDPMPGPSAVQPRPMRTYSASERHRSVGTQAKIGQPLKILTPRPWLGSDASASSSEQHRPASTTSSISRPASLTTPQPLHSVSSGVSADDASSISRPESIASQEAPTPDASRVTTPHSEHNYFSPASTPDASRGRHEERASSFSGISLSKRPSKNSNSSVKIVMGRGANKGLRVEAVSIKEGHLTDTEPAIKSLKQGRSGKISRKRLKPAAFVSNLDGRGRVLHTKDDFVNELVVDENEKSTPRPLSRPPSSIWRPVELKQEEEGDDKSEEDEKPYLQFELISEHGFRTTGRDPTVLWQEVFDAVAAAREELGMEPVAFNPVGRTGLQMLGLTHNAMAFLLEQMPGAKEASKYGFKMHERIKEEAEELKENPTGCARSEPFKNRKPLDMFSWLASRHRKRPLGELSSYSTTSSAAFGQEGDQLLTNRRATSLDLPMAMRFRHLAKHAKEAVGVYSSAIHGRGLYCKREIQAGEMVIEYAGEEIRAMLTDKREKYYESRGIGCYMFKIDDDTVVDATMNGNAARFINHSCDPNCYSKIVDILGKKHIIIFALRKILPGEELTYDYKFPIEDVKLPCNCGAKKCRKYMN